MEKKSTYKWKFSKIGGVTRVSIESGDDIAHLDELDEKMWTVLSCPSSGLEFDEKTLKMIDADHDGQIRVNDVVTSAKWITNVLTNNDLLLKHASEINLSDINQSSDEGQKLYKSAKQILANLQKEKETISIEDTSDTIAIFAKTQFNGDGIITEKSADEEALQKIIHSIIETTGSKEDRSGEPGVDKEIVEKFYAECADFDAWNSQSVSNAASILPYGSDTEAALNAYNAVKTKVDDYFVRCKMVAFNKDTCNALEIQLDELTKISGENLADNIDKIAAYPLARISENNVLNLNQGINPAWQAKIADVKRLIFDKDFAGKEQITEDEWNSIAGKFAPYTAWKGDKKGASVESLGADAVKQIVTENRQQDILNLIEKDSALKDESDSILSVDKLLHLCRDFHIFLRNFVTFTDFYDRDFKAIFQAGTLYIDQRSCDLCIKVADTSKHGADIVSSGIYLLYCDCVNKVKNKTMQIAAAITDGDIDNLMVGKHALFYDRDGGDWDATVTKIIDNPISIRQAFWTPYRKFSNFIEEQVTKFAASKDEKMTGDALGQISNAGTKLTEKPAEGAVPVDPLLTEKKQAFDIAKFCGIFAAIGMALGMIGTFLASAATGFLALSVPKMILAILGILLLISGPSMFLAWLKLRKRNLSPILNANGWALNSSTKVNTLFGATFTQLVKFPVIGVKDPFVKKKSKLRFLWWGLIILAVLFVICYLKGWLTRFGLPYQGSPVQEFIDSIFNPVVSTATDAATDVAPDAAPAE
ncbi:MAG: hypothetical protein J5882_04430 [Bacteroidales bacterium]|nr:hypothetical protein [Bacteroidales bacterium]